MSDLSSVDEFLNSTDGTIGGDNDSGDGDYSDGYSIDYRIRQLSYSSLLTFHSCPRKYQLYKLQSQRTESEDTRQSVTFAFGHVVGEGIQLVLEELQWDQIVWKLFLSWHADIFDEDTKADKSFWSALLAVRKFMNLREQGLLKDYRLVRYQGKPACELSFCITFPNGFRYRGFVDAVLQHELTGEIIVLECKTTGLKVLNPSMYKNSAQAIGYSIVLDAIFPELSSYKVVYLTYQTQQREFTAIPFDKTYLQRALWIRELMLDIELIEMYEREQIYPMHGESCFNFYRDCEYLNVCTLSTEHLTIPMKESAVDKTEYQVTLTLQDLLESQFRKTEV